MSDEGFPVTIAPFEQGTGRYTVAKTGVVNTATYKARTLMGYGDKSGNDSVDWPEKREENPYQRVVIRGGGNSMVSGRGSDSVLGDTYTGEAPISYLSGGASEGDSVHNPFTNANGADGHAPEIYQLLVNRLFDKLNQQKFNAAQFIAERRQLVGLVTSSANKIATSLLMLKRGKFRDAQRALTGSNRPLGNSAVRRNVRYDLGGIPERWLELQYGWKPLLGDIYGAAEELADLVVDTDPPVVSCRVGAKASKGTKSYDVHIGGLFPTVRWTRETSETQGYAFVECKLASDFGQTLARTGMTNPYQLAWELLPWSFVVDWFIPVGQYLTRLNADVGLRFSRGWWTEMTTDTWTSSVINNTLTSGSFTIQWQGGSFYSCEGMRFDRHPISILPVPSLPRLKNPFSLIHTANALSLMAVSFNRPKGTFDFVAPRQGLPGRR